MYCDVSNSVLETRRYRVGTLRNRPDTWPADNGPVVSAHGLIMKTQLIYYSTIAYSVFVAAWICYACCGQ